MQIVGNLLDGVFCLMQMTMRTVAAESANPPSKNTPRTWAFRADGNFSAHIFQASQLFPRHQIRTRLTQGSGSMRMHKSRTASRTVNIIVGRNPNGQFSLMPASDPQLAEKFSRQVKTNPKKKASIHPIVMTMTMVDTMVNLPTLNIRR
jgi:hypothetical protein